MRTLSTLASGLALMLLLLPAPLRAAVTEDQIVSEVMSIGAVTGAADQQAELQKLITQLVNDSGNYGGMGLDLTDSKTIVLHFRGTTVSTLAACLPLLPGTIGDSASLKGKLAARLKTEVTTYLLNNTYWDWEYAPANGGVYVTPANPRVSISWHHRWRVGPQWEKMYALWAYAYYTGDWTTISNTTNWNFIKARYTDAYKTPDLQQRACIIGGGVPHFRNGANDLANGLIGFTRMAEHINDSIKTTARTQARAAVIDALNHLDVPWDACPVYEGWDNVAKTARGEWTPGYNLTPELGRYINDRAKTTAQTRLDAAANNAALAGHWWCGYLNNTQKNNSSFMNEDAWGMPNLSHELFLGRAWMLMEDGAALDGVQPWHVVMGRTPEYRDMLYLRSLYALISRHAAITWVAAN